MAGMGRKLPLAPPEIAVLQHRICGLSSRMRGPAPFHSRVAFERTLGVARTRVASLRLLRFGGQFLRARTRRYVTFGTFRGSHHLFNNGAVETN